MLTLEEAKKRVNNTYHKIIPVNKDGELCLCKFSVINGIMYDTEDGQEEVVGWENNLFVIETHHKYIDDYEYDYYEYNEHYEPQDYGDDYFA